MSFLNPVSASVAALVESVSISVQVSVSVYMYVSVSIKCLPVTAFYCFCPNL